MAKGAMVLADSLKENKTLQEILLDANPIGTKGGRAVLRAMRFWSQTFQDERQISVAKCNMAVTSASDLFDPLEPGGFWSCDLADPYERVVANELVQLAVRARPGRLSALSVP